MASRESLKSDLKMLKETFPESHKRFQISQSATDQLTCRFIAENGKKYDIHANIPDDYPSEPFLWYTDSDETSVEEIVANLGATNQNKPILNQIDFLLRELCRLHKVEIPTEATNLTHGEGSSGIVKSEDSIGEQAKDKKEDGYAYGSDDSLDSDDLESAFTDEEESPHKNPSDDTPPFKKIHMDLIKKGKLQPESSSNVATSRLMKEITEIYRSPTFKNGDYTIELVDDSIYNWNIELRCIDGDSELAKDLIKLKEKEGKDSIVINITFDDKYPIEPPFVRVVYPIVRCIHVTIGGAFCTALLLKQCWSPAYTIESVIVQMAALLVKGNARICFDSPIQYSLAAAKTTFAGVMSRKQADWYDQHKESS